MKKLLLTLLAVVGLSTVATAETSTLTFTSGDQLDKITSTNPQTVSTPKGFEWTFSMTGTGTIQQFDSTKGIHFGSNKVNISSLDITSNGFLKKRISKVTVNTSGTSSVKASVSVTVGTTQFTYGESETSYTLNATATDVEFTGEAVGEINISYTVTAAAIYIKSIVVEYEDAPDAKLEPGLSFPKHDYYVSLSKVNEFEAPELDNPYNVTPLKFVSSDKNIAIVDDTTGEVALEATIGKVTITVSYEGSDEYEADKQSYVIHIIEEEFMTVTFDFENNEYGMTRYNSDNSGYNKDNTKFGNEWVVCTANSKTRLWQSSDGKSMRVYNGGEIVIETPVNTTITNIGIYHFHKDADPDEVTDDSDHEHVAEIEGNRAVLSAQWSSAHKLSMIEITYSGKEEHHTAAIDAFKAAPAEHFTIKVDGVEQTGSTISIDQTKTEGVNLELSHYYPHATIYTKFTPKASSETQGMYYDALEGYTAHTQALPLTQEGTLNYYAELNGHQTAVQTLTVSDPTSTSIADIQAAGAAEYFDMQGRRVNAPANGIFIRKQGNKAVKVSL